ncbi:hypothetical protein Poly24_05130 [Rosistilla carotiformis]|uniref:RiboL-PSP-HEPN domain-containing protein n=1 Tax=Rosistilla carotiformis TaxID=2528017 RepID=A0A518JMN7_9BACT|nr:hypothetical protein [Rosistilla carotiformis]QDV66825.1 hypothetical protein Poly24_05130 [Rosistilla carotiformis]
MNDHWTYFVREYLRIKIDELRHYIATVESALDKEFNTFDNWVADQTSQMTEDAKSDFYDFHSDTAWNLSESFPRMTRNAIFSSAYFSLEHELLAICKQLRARKKIPLAVNDLKHNGITAASVYLRKVGGIEFPSNTQEWQRITIYNKIRNFIAHNDGTLDKSDNAAAVRQYAKTHPHISFSSSDEIILGQDFCTQTLDTIETFFNAVLDAIDSQSDG